MTNTWLRHVLTITYQQSTQWGLYCGGRGQASLTCMDRRWGPNIYYDRSKSETVAYSTPKGNSARICSTWDDPPRSTLCMVGCVVPVTASPARTCKKLGHSDSQGVGGEAWAAPLGGVEDRCTNNRRDILAPSWTGPLWGWANGYFHE